MSKGCGIKLRLDPWNPDCCGDIDMRTGKRVLCGACEKLLNKEEVRR